MHLGPSPDRGRDRRRPPARRGRGRRRQDQGVERRDAAALRSRIRRRRPRAGRVEQRRGRGHRRGRRAARASAATPAAASGCPRRGAASTDYKPTTGLRPHHRSLPARRPGERRPHHDRPARAATSRSIETALGSSPGPTVATPASHRCRSRRTAARSRGLRFAVLPPDPSSPGRRRGRRRGRPVPPSALVDGRASAQRDWSWPWLDEARDVTQRYWDRTARSRAPRSRSSSGTGTGSGAGASSQFDDVDVLVSPAGADGRAAATARSAPTTSCSRCRRA